MRKCQGKCGLTIPVSDEDKKDFCEYMNYAFVKKVGDTYYYKLPLGHPCRFIINFNRWAEGTFDKEHFLNSLKN